MAHHHKIDNDSINPTREEPSMTPPVSVAAAGLLAPPATENPSRRRSMKLSPSTEVLLERAAKNRLNQLYCRRVLYSPVKHLLSKHKLSLCIGSIFGLAAAILRSDFAYNSRAFVYVESKEDVPELWSLCYLVSIFAVIRIFSQVAERLLLKLADLLSNTRFWKFWFYVSALEQYVSRVIWLFSVLSSWKLIIRFRSSCASCLWIEFVHKVLQGLLLSQSIFIARQIMLKWLIWKLEAQNFMERVKSIDRREKLVRRLAKSAFIFRPVLSERDQVDSPFQNELEKETLSHMKKLEKTFSFVLPTVSDYKQSNQPKSKDFVANVLKSQKKSDLEKAVHFVELKTRKNCKDFAERLWRKLVPPGEKEIPLEEFYSFYSSSADAEEAFLLFKQGASLNPITSLEDVLGSFGIDMSTFEDSMQRMREERNSLTSDLQSFSSIFTVVRAFLYALSWIGAAFLFLKLLGVPVGALALSSFSVTLSFSFAFKSSISRIVESAMFLVAARPFNVGDRIKLGDKTRENLIVTKITLMYTEVQTPDQQTLFLPNYELIKENVFNMNRMEGSKIVLQFKFHINTTSDQLNALRSSLENYAKRNKEVFLSNQVFLFIEAIEDFTRLNISLWMGLRTKWQESAQIRKAKSKLWEFLIEETLRLRIVCPETVKPTRLTC